MLKVPNLFHEKDAKEAKTLYSLYLSHLAGSDRKRRVVETCRQIRRYAARLKHSPDADFTYLFEIDALCKLHMFPDAWRQLRRLERIAYGKNIKLVAKVWKQEELEWFWHFHPQILYFLGRFNIAAKMLEAVLCEAMRQSQNGVSYELFFHIYNPINQPLDRHEVTLHHLYRKLGKSLLSWPKWEKFVRGFHPRLFRLTGIKQERLLRDASLLIPFYQAITKERKKRLTAGVSLGERELIDPPSKVKRFQNGVARKRRPKDLMAVQREQQIKQLFPEL